MNEGQDIAKQVSQASRFLEKLEQSVSRVSGIREQTEERLAGILSPKVPAPATDVVATNEKQVELGLSPLVLTLKELAGRLNHIADKMEGMLGRSEL